MNKILTKMRSMSGSSTKSSAAVWPIPTIPVAKKGSLSRSLSMIPQKKKLTTTFSDIFKRDDIQDQYSDDVFIKDYNDLRIELQLLPLFPKDEDIPVRRLLRLWVAEGFVKQPFPEDLAQKHFDELVDRGMIQITILRSDNSPRKCRLVSPLQDYLSPISLFYIHHDLECFKDVAAGPFGVRRLVHHMTTTGVLPDIFKPSLLRSFLSFNRPHKDTSAKEVLTILSRITIRENKVGST